MPDYRPAREILDAHATAGVSPDGALSLRPDTVVLAGVAATAALARVTEPLAFLDAGRVVLLEGDCPRGGGGAGAAQLQRLAASAGFRFVSVSEGCPTAIIRDLGLAAPGALVAAFGLGVGRGLGTGALLWPLDTGGLDALLAAGVYTVPAPPVYRMTCLGSRGPGVTAADMGLYLAAQFGAGGARGAVLEFGGPATDGDEDVGEAFADAASLCDAAALVRGPGAEGAAQARYAYDFTPLVPQYAAARGDAFDVAPLASAEMKFVRNVVIGPAAAADVAAAARVLAGARIHSDIGLWVAPASRRVHFDATAEGWLTVLVEAGANILPSCMLPRAEELAGGALAVTSACAFRACAARGPVYYVSAAAAAAAALAGELCDPTPLFQS